MCEDCCVVEVGVGLADDDRPSDLTPPCALHVNDGYLANPIEQIDHGFDLGRVHVLATRDIDVFPTIDDTDVSLLADPGNVAGLEVAVDEARFVCLGVLPVTGVTFGPRVQISPISPGTTSLPSALTTRTSVWSAAKPADPIFFNVSSGLSAVPIGDVSVRPSPCWRARPSAPQASSSGSSDGAPPKAAATTVGNVAVSKDGCWLMNT
jgi:hypothetical protein